MVGIFVAHGTATKMARVWIVPTPLSSFTNEYEPAKDRTNDFFEILAKKSSGIFSFIPSSEDYLLSLKNGEWSCKQH